jgi:hypothetical protein
MELLEKLKAVQDLPFKFGIFQLGTRVSVADAFPFRWLPSDGIGILPLICAWPPRCCTI